MEQEFVDETVVDSIVHQMGTRIASIPLLADLGRNLASILAANGDTDGFLSDQIQDAIASLNAFLVLFEKRPAEIMCQLLPDKEFIESQIEILKKFLA